MHPLLALLGLATLGLSVDVARRGAAWLTRYRQLAGTSGVDTGTVGAHERVTLSGTAEGESTFPSPVAKRECLLAAWRIERYSESSDMWETLATGAHALPFAIDDGSGAVTVDLRARAPDGETPATYEDWLDGGGPVDEDVVQRFGGFEQVTRHGPDETPDHLRDLTVRAGADLPEKRALSKFDLVTEHDERRYYETVVEPGDDVFVLGTVRPDPDATRPHGGDDLAVRPPVDRTFVVSNRPGSAVRAYVRNRMVLIPGALALGLVGLGALVGALVLPEPLTKMGSLVLMFVDVVVLAGLKGKL